MKEEEETNNHTRGSDDTASDSDGSSACDWNEGRLSPVSTAVTVA